MHQILEAGGEYDESVEPIDKWLTFLTNPNHLRPGLHDLTVYFGDARMCSIAVTFDSTEASLRSLKLELQYFPDEDSLALFQEKDPQANQTITSNAGALPNPHRLKEWVFGLFFHPALEELEIEFHVPELPDLFHQIPKLRAAHFNYSKFIRLPSSFYQLPALERLAIKDAPIPELPFELGNLRTLRYLEISQGCFSVAWKNLTALTELQYYGSAITVPGEMMLLANLKTLALSAVSEVRDNFLHFPKLEKLFFRVSRSPANFRFTAGDLPRLKELNTDNAEVFINTLSAFKTLEKLSVSGKVSESALPAFTEALNQLHNLTSVSLEKTGITNLDWCSSLLNLEYLNVENNAITIISPGLSKLQKLKTIILKKNPVSTFPELEPMPQVTFIDLKNTKIPIDQNAGTDLQPIPEELNRLKHAFPNVEYLASMNSNT